MALEVRLEMEMRRGAEASVTDRTDQLAREYLEGLRIIGGRSRKVMGAVRCMHIGMRQSFVGGDG